MDMNYSSEWRCKTFRLQKWLLLSGSLCLLILVAFLWHEAEANIELMLITIIMVGFLCVIVMLLIEKNTYSIVHFTPDFIVVDGVEVDISQLTLIKFVRYVKNNRNHQLIITGLEFMMSFKPESGIKRYIKFVMQFGGLGSNLSTYNYRDRFIKVVWGWVAAASKDEK